MERETSNENQDVDTNRGIRDAGVRYRERTQNRLTSEQVRKTRRHSTGRSRGSRGATSDRTFSQRFSNVNTAELQRVYQNIHDLFEKSVERIDDTEIKELTDLEIEQPQHPDFPYIIFSIAVLKDIIDPIDISGIGVILTTATSFLVTLIIFIWFMGKMNLSGAKRSIINRLWKRMIQSKLWLRFIGLIGLEYVPFLKILPGTTILILMIHFSEKKIVKLIDAALEEILASKIK